MFSFEKEALEIADSVLRDFSGSGEIEHKAQVVERDLQGEKLSLVTVVYNKEMNRVRTVWLDWNQLDRVIEVNVSHGPNGWPVATIKMYADVKREVKDG